MADEVVIKDDPSTMRWLKMQEPQIQAWFASRCALRSMPRIGFEPAVTSNGITLCLFRACLMSAAVSTCPHTKIASLANFAQIATDAAYAMGVPSEKPTRDSYGSATNALFASLVVAKNAQYHDSANSTTNPTDIRFIAQKSGPDAARVAATCAFNSASSDADATSAATMAWSAANADLEYVGGWPPLWPGDTMPEGLKDGWNKLTAQFDAAPDPGVWRFWRDWYAALLAGTWTDWELIYRIAKEITPEEWDAGPETVATRIAGIRAEQIVAILPQVEEVFETEDGLYDVRGAVADTSKLLGSVMSRVSFALDTATQSNQCDLGEMSLAAKVLRQALDVLPDDPNSAESFFRQASDLIKKRIASGQYAEDDELVLLIGILDESALQLRADHPDVAEAYETRLRRVMREIEDVKRLQLAQAIDDLRDGTGPRLNAELGLAAEVTRDGSSPAASAEAAKQSGNRAAKITIAERAKQAEGSGLMSMGKIGLRAQTVWEIVSGLF